MQRAPGGRQGGRRRRDREEKEDGDAAAPPPAPGAPRPPAPAPRSAPGAEPRPLRRKRGGERLWRAAVREDGLEGSRELGKSHLYPPVAEPGGAGQRGDRLPPGAAEHPPPPALSDTFRLQHLRGVSGISAHRNPVL